MSAENSKGCKALFSFAIRFRADKRFINHIRCAARPVATETASRILRDLMIGLQDFPRSRLESHRRGGRDHQLVDGVTPATDLEHQFGGLGISSTNRHNCIRAQWAIVNATEDSSTDRLPRQFFWGSARDRSSISEPILVFELMTYFARERFLNCTTPNWPWQSPDSHLLPRSSSPSLWLCLAHSISLPLPFLIPTTCLKSRLELTHKLSRPSQFRFKHPGRLLLNESTLGRGTE
jgi:hypothetical protein